MSGTPAYIQPVGINQRRVAGATALLADLHERVLFNCGESFQRLSSEWRLKISKVSDVIMMQVDPVHIGGLTGLLLTLEGIEAPSFDYKSKKTRTRVTESLNAVARPNGQSAPAYTELIKEGAKFGTTFTDSNWRQQTGDLRLINPCAPQSDSKIVVWWRALLPRHNPGGQGRQTYEEYIRVRHTIRNIRIWGPPGLARVMRSHVALTARLRRLAVEFIELHPTPGGTPFAKDMFSLLDVDLTMWSQVRSSRVQQHCDSSAAKRRKTEEWTIEGAGCIPIIVGRGKRQLGRFLVEKAAALNVPAGPLYARLKSGASVNLPDGSVVESAQVCEKAVEGLPFLITHCTDEDQAAQARDALLTEPALVAHLARMREDGGYIYNLGVDIFGADSDVITITELEEPRSAKIQQIFMTDELNDKIPLPFIAQQGLNLAIRDLLPTLHPLHVPSAATKSPFLRRFPLVPQCKLAPGAAAFVDVESMVLAEKEEILRRLSEELKTKAKNLDIRDTVCLEHTCAREFRAGDSRITLLGTGAAVPSKFRNVSSTIIVAEKNFNVLLDCGEGTLTQLYQFYGNDAPQMIGDIRLIFISHKHGDHINGLPCLLRHRQQLPHRQKLYIAGPAEMREWFDDHCGSDFEFSECESHLGNLWTPLFDTGSMSVSMRTTYVDHIACGPDESACFACRLRLSQGPRKMSLNPLMGAQGGAESCKLCAKDLDIAFTGDMAPCSGFTSMICDDAKKLDVLIHEATFEDELAHEAVARRHCTISDCIQSGKESKCELLVMTHFSQRYPSVSANDSQGLNVAHGLDFLTIPISSIWNGELDSSVRAALELDRDIIASLQDKLKLAAEADID